MKNILAAAMMIAMGSIGVGCASGAEPTEDDTITVNSDEQPSAELTRRFCGPFAAQIRRSAGKNVKVQIRFSGDELRAPAVCAPCEYGIDLKTGACLPKPAEPVGDTAPAEEQQVVAAPTR